MLASIFSKSKPINIVIVSALMILGFTLLSIIEFEKDLNVTNIATGLFALLLTLFLLDFIISKNSLTKKNSYAIMFFGLFLALFPEVFLYSDYLWSNIFVLLAIRRLLSMHSRKHLKQKFFDAAFWLALASLLNPWTAVFFILILVALVYYSGNDVKTILIPFVAVLCVLILKVSYNILMFNSYFYEADFEYEVLWQFENYLSLKYSMKLLVFLPVLIWSLIKLLFSLKDKKAEVKPSYILLFWSCLIGLVVSCLSPLKDGGELIYLLGPAAVVLALNLESIKKEWISNTFVTVFIILPLVTFFL